MEELIHDLDRGNVSHIGVGLDDDELDRREERQEERLEQLEESREERQDRRGD